MVRLSVVLFFVATIASAHSVVDVGMSFDVPSFVPVGQNFRYRVIADDRANDIGLGIVVTIVLPSQVRFVSIEKNSTWKCTQSNLTVTCAADSINAGPNPIDINVTAPPTTTAMHATASVQSVGSLDFNATNDNASSDVVAYEVSLCTAAPPQILAPDDGSREAGIVRLAWSAVPGAQSYAIETAVEGAAASSVASVGSTSTSIPAEPGTSEWWVVASFATCPPVESGHRHFAAVETLARPVRTYLAGFNRPYGIAFSPTGDVYVSDEADNTIRQITNGSVTTISGKAGVQGNTDGQFALLRNPRGIVVTPLDGLVYAADTLNHEIRILYTGGAYVVTYNAGGAPGIAGMVDDTSDKARFNSPSALATTLRGTLFVADTANNRIRRMDQVPGYLGYFSVTTVASGLHAPAGVAVGPGDAVYIADTNDGSIRKLNGTVIASGFDHPTGIAADARGNLFVTEGTSVQRIAPSGLVTRVATGFVSPAGIIVDATDHIFVADRGAHAILVIDPPAIASRHRVAH